jgi:hypothetical protein
MEMGIRCGGGITGSFLGIMVWYCTITERLLSFRGGIACFRDLMGRAQKYNVTIFTGMNFIELIDLKSSRVVVHPSVSLHMPWYVQFLKITYSIFTLQVLIPLAKVTHTPQSSSKTFLSTRIFIFITK